MEQVIKNSVDTDLKQRAVFYYRMLRHDPAVAEKIVNGSYGKIEEFYEDKNEEIRDRLFLEFNSLSVVYQRPSERFLKDNILKHVMAIEKKYYKVKSRKRDEVKAITQDGEDEEEDNADGDKKDKKKKKEEVKAIEDKPAATLDDLIDFGGGGPVTGAG